MSPWMEGKEFLWQGERRVGLRGGRRAEENMASERRSGCTGGVCGGHQTGWPVRCEGALSSRRWGMGLPSVDGGWRVGTPALAQTWRGEETSENGQVPSGDLSNGDLVQPSAQPQPPHLLLRNVTWTQRPSFCPRSASSFCSGTSLGLSLLGCTATGWAP